MIDASQRSFRDSRPEPLPAKLVDQLFSRMAVIYGHLWASRFLSGDMVSLARAEWGQSLSGYSSDVIGKGIDICKQVHELPPTLPQFVACCKKARADLTVASDCYQGIEAQKARPEVAELYIAVMRGKACMLEDAPERSAA